MALVLTGLILSALDGVFYAIGSIRETLNPLTNDNSWIEKIFENIICEYRECDIEGIIELKKSTIRTKTSPTIYLCNVEKNNKLQLNEQFSNKTSNQTMNLQTFHISKINIVNNILTFASTELEIIEDVSKQAQTMIENIIRKIEKYCADSLEDTEMENNKILFGEQFKYVGLGGILYIKIKCTISIMSIKNRIDTNKNFENSYLHKNFL